MELVVGVAGQRIAADRAGVGVPDQARAVEAQPLGVVRAVRVARVDLAVGRPRLWPVAAAPGVPDADLFARGRYGLLGRRGGTGGEYSARLRGLLCRGRRDRCGAAGTSPRGQEGECRHRHRRRFPHRHFGSPVPPRGVPRGVRLIVAFTACSPYGARTGRLPDTPSLCPATPPCRGSAGRPLERETGNLWETPLNRHFECSSTDPSLASRRPRPSLRCRPGPGPAARWSAGPARASLSSRTAPDPPASRPARPPWPPAPRQPR